MWHMFDDRLFRVTKTKKNATWRDKPVVKYGGIQTAIQTYIYSFFDDPIRYDVKVELIKIESLGEIDMEAYRKRNKIETFLK